ncbi:16408_t:CDS:10 [Dentiscutata heterogama]|uniref:16408_t:CDS:1 n=1 Tax=Dentiscutata heterogama TaxID=1316150 RepID=A0ACA9K993_9GLOM|nr:16408_t:CDS:10 [Dentiscutata heterogama]
MAKYVINTMAPLQEENSQKFEYLIPTVKSSPESQSSNIPIQIYKKEGLLSINHANLGPFSPRTQSMIDELEKHVDELANSELATSDDQIFIFDSPHEIKSDVTLDSTSIPLIIDIQKDSEDDIQQDLGQIDQNSLANDPGSYNNKTYYSKDEKSNKCKCSEKIRLSLEEVSFNLKNVMLDQEIRVQVEDDQALNSIGLDSPRTFKVLPVNFDPSPRIDSNVKKSIRLMVGLITYHTKPSTSLEEQLKKSFLFPFNYHSFVFDTMKLVIYEYGSFLNKKKKYGRVIVQLSALKQTIIDHKEFEGIFPIKANGSLLEIGAVQINIKFHFPNDPPLTPTPFIHSPLSPISRDCSKLDNDDNDDNIETHPDAISLGILDTVLSQETRDAIKEITALYHTFFGHGWRLTKLEFLKAYMLLEKYYNQKNNPVTENLCYDIDLIKNTLRYLQFSMASYGSFLFNWFGYGPRNAFGITSDQKIIRKFFNLDKSDIICWEYGQKAVSVPNYMVVRDPETNSIIISIRGTMNITDLITDALAHYEPWNGGFVHRGAFRSAQHLIKHSLKEIRDAIVKYNINSIKIMGHSLGASISSITTLLLREHCKDMLDRGVDIHAWNFATFPCCSLDVASKTDTLKCIHNFVNENDIIPRLSYGNLMDFKELVKFAASELKNDEYKELRSKHKLSKIFSSIDEYRKTLKLNSSSQKLYIPGKIYYLYKRHSLSHLETSSSLFHNKEVVCEESRPDLFTDICLRRNWLFHHFPDRYDKRLKGVIKFLTKESVERTP